MTRKDYATIAACIKATMNDNDDTEDRVDNAVRQHVASLASALAREFAKDNPRFDRPRFLAACGVQA